MANVANLASIVSQVEALEVLAINEDLALAWVVEALDHLDSGGLARAGGTDNRVSLARLKSVVQAAHYHLVWACWIEEVNVFEFDLALNGVLDAAFLANL